MFVNFCDECVVSRKIFQWETTENYTTNQTKSGMAEYCTQYSVLSDQAFMANCKIKPNSFGTHIID